MQQDKPAAFEKPVSEIACMDEQSAEARDGHERRAARARDPRLAGHVRPLDLFFLLSGFLIAGIPTTWAASARAQEAPPPALPSLPPAPDASRASPSPASPAPTPSASPSPPASASTVRVHLVTNATGVQLLFRKAPDSTNASTGSGADIHQYSASCVAPCDLELPPGDYYVALSKAGGRAYEQPIPLSVRSATTIDGTYESHSGMRVTGIVFMSTLVPIGAVLALVGAEAGTSTCSISPDGSGTEQCTTTNSSDSGLVAAGVVILGAGLLLGIAFAVRHDDAAVQVVPLATAPAAVRGGASERAPGSNGLALRFTF